VKRLATVYACLFLLTAGAALAAPAGVSPSALILDDAIAAFDGKDWPRAAALYRQLAEDNPLNGRYWYNLGVAEYSQKNYRPAIAAYDRAIGVGYQVGTSHYNRACCFALLGESTAAIDGIDTAIRNGLRNREELLRTDTDLDALRALPAFQARILPVASAATSREEGWRMDLAYLTKRVSETHYDPFRYITRAEWDAEVARISAALPTLKDHEVVAAMAALLVRVNDGHTGLSMPRSGTYQFHTLPIQLWDFPDGLYVQAASPEHAGLVGKRVVKVGNTPAREALDQVAVYTQRDNTQQIRWIAPRMLTRPELLDALGITKGLDGVEITVADERGREQRVKLAAAPLVPEHGRRGAPAGWVDMAKDAKDPLPLWRRDTERLFALEYLPDERVVYAGFHAVLDDEHESLADFTARVMKMVDEKEVDALVIDVRDNNGGNNFLAQTLFQRIQASEKVNQPGKLFVIIGRETFSACQNFCNWMDLRTEALFVGEPTGSRPNFTGEGNTIQLPWSGITANASSRRWQDSVSEDERQWIAPEFSAVMTAEDYRTNRDPALATILEYLKKKRTQHAPN